MSLHRSYARNGDSRFENRFMIGHDNGLAIKILPYHQRARIMLYTWLYDRYQLKKSSFHVNVLHDACFSISLTNLSREDRTINKLLGFFQSRQMCQYDCIQISFLFQKSVATIYILKIRHVNIYMSALRTMYLPINKQLRPTDYG